MGILDKLFRIKRCKICWKPRQKKSSSGDFCNACYASLNRKAHKYHGESFNFLTAGQQEKIIKERSMEVN